MNKSTLAIVIVAVVAVGGFFLLRGSQPASTPTPTASPTRETSTLPTSGTQPSPSPGGTNIQTEGKTVVYGASGFSPATLRVKSGETVTFKNESSNRVWPASDVHPTHRLYSGTSLSDHCPDETNSAFDACRGLSPGEEWSFTFTKSGTWTYHDHLNPQATGTIVVE
jgi:plastocyanin